MISYAEDYGKFLLTFRAKILIRGHPFSLLSQSNLVVIKLPLVFKRGLTDTIDIWMTSVNRQPIASMIPHLPMGGLNQQAELLTEMYSLPASVPVVVSCVEAFQSPSVDELRSVLMPGPHRRWLLQNL